jgi:uncharacterized protein GlcG (DUF336 family)
MTLTLSDALTLTEHVIAYSGERKWRVSVAVVDAAGHTISVQRTDTAMWFTPAIAVAKARTCVACGGPSDKFADMRINKPEVWEQFGLQLPFTPTTLRGGILIEVDGRAVGAIGVSGATSDEDVEAAEFAIARWRG